MSLASALDVGWGPIGVAAGGAFACALAGGLLTSIGPWYRSLRKPTWQPPDWAFGPAWTLIFALAALSAALGWVHAPDRQTAARVVIFFVANALLNVAWSFLFFTCRRPKWALPETVVLWLSVVLLIVTLAGFTPLGSWLLIPYMLWVAFAGYLNLTIVRLNRPLSRN